jgi:hypothetical protein
MTKPTSQIGGLVIVGGSSLFSVGEVDKKEG